MRTARAFRNKFQKQDLKGTNLVPETASEQSSKCLASNKKVTGLHRSRKTGPILRSRVSQSKLTQMLELVDTTMKMLIVTILQLFRTLSIDREQPERKQSGLKLPHSRLSGHSVGRVEAAGGRGCEGAEEASGGDEHVPCPDGDGFTGLYICPHFKLYTFNVYSLL